MTAALLLVGLTLVVLPSGLHLHHLEAALTSGRCESGGNAASQACTAAKDSFTATLTSLTGIVPWLNFLPGIAGALIAAPLIAREVEDGTWRLAWSQGTTRRQWLRWQLAGTGALVALSAIAFTIVVTWWLSPLNHLDGRFGPTGHGFDFYGLIPTAWAICAFAIGILAGTVIRRVVPAIAVTIGVYLGVRLPVEFFIRPHYLSPARLWGVQPGVAAPLSRNDWLFGQDLVAPHSHRILSPSQLEVVQRVAQAASPNPKTSGPDVQFVASLAPYLRTHGYTYVFTYQPAGRFWTFQGTEAVLCLMVAATALAASRWLVLHRLT